MVALVNKKTDLPAPFNVGYIQLVLASIHGPGRDPITTVDHPDIRGLVTGLTWVRRGAASV